jgi:hypothetical protein
MALQRLNRPLTAHYYCRGCGELRTAPADAEQWERKCPAPGAKSDP